MMKKYKQSVGDFHEFKGLKRKAENGNGDQQGMTMHSFSIWKRNRDRPW